MLRKFWILYPKVIIRVYNQKNWLVFLGSLIQTHIKSSYGLSTNKIHSNSFSVTVVRPVTVIARLETDHNNWFYYVYSFAIVLPSIVVVPSNRRIIRGIHLRHSNYSRHKNSKMKKISLKGSFSFQFHQCCKEPSIGEKNVNTIP